LGAASKVTAGALGALVNLGADVKLAAKRYWVGGWFDQPFPSRFDAWANFLRRMFLSRRIMLIS